MIASVLITADTSVMSATPRRIWIKWHLKEPDFRTLSPQHHGRIPRWQGHSRESQWSPETVLLIHPIHDDI
jgi:hypothetical protein